MSTRHLAWFQRLLLAILLTTVVPSSPTKAASPDGRAQLPATAPQAQPGVTPPPPTPIKVQPRVPEQLPSLSVHLDIAPDPIELGKTATLTVTLANNSSYAAEDVVVSLPATPEMLVTKGTGVSLSGWKWSVGKIASQATTTLTGQFVLLKQPAGDAVILTASAAARGLALPIQEIGGAFVAPSALSEITGLFTPGKDTTLQGADGRFSVQLPANAAKRKLDLRIGRTPETGDARPPILPSGRAGLGSFFLDATDDTGNALHTFDTALTFSYRYTPEQLQARGLNEQTLTFLWFDEAANEWTPIPSTVNTKDQTVSAQVDHFSAFALSDGSSPSDAYLPSLQGFQTSLFTGAASYSYPIDIPAGPGGLKPAFSLDYTKRT